MSEPTAPLESARPAQCKTGASLAWSQVLLSWRLLNERATNVRIGEDDRRESKVNSPELPILQAIDLLAQIAAANGFAEQARQRLEAGLSSGARVAAQPIVPRPVDTIHSGPHHWQKVSLDEPSLKCTKCDTWAYDTGARWWESHGHQELHAASTASGEDPPMPNDSLGGDEEIGGHYKDGLLSRT